MKAYSEWNDTYSQEGSWEEIREAVRQGWEEVADSDAYKSHRHHFESHYNDYYAATAHDFDYYEAAYRYGYQLARMPVHRDSNWEDIEAGARANWREEYADEDSTWEDVKDAVRYAWQSVQ